MPFWHIQFQTQLKITGHTTFSRTLRNILAIEGFPGLFRGITASMLREASYSSIRMGLYEPARRFVAPDRALNEISLWQKIVAGFFAGGVGSALANPTDLVKIRFQARLPEQAPVYKHTFHAFWQIFQLEGIRGLYKGVIPTTLRAAILTSAQLSSYDHSKVLLKKLNILPDGPAVHLIASFIAGLVATTATSPVDVIKTRVMNASHGEYSGPLDCFLQLMKKEGPRALFRGWLPNYLRLGPHFIISLPLYEQLRSLFGAGYL